MKKLLFGLLSILLVSSVATAQEGKKAFKEAEKIIKNFEKDPVANAATLADAFAMFDKAFMSEEVSGDAKYMAKKGAALNMLAGSEIKTKLLDPNYVVAAPQAASMAMDAFKKLLASGEKEKDAYKGLAATEAHLNNTAIIYFQAQDYANSYKNYAASLETADLLKAAGKKSMFDDPVALADQKFITAATAYYSDNVQNVLPILNELYAAGTDKPLVYEALYNAKKESDPEGALAILDAGRAALPDDSGLLFAEINHYLTAGQLDVLISKLEMAKQKEPDNLSVVVTMGSVFDQLNQKEREAGNIEKADEYLMKAKGSYEEVLTAQPDNFDATYSLGALYYNKAAAMTDKINALSNDFTPAGTKKYEALKAEMDGYFQEALPYFEAAEKINNNDINTLIALKEIAARGNDFEKSGAYKARIEALQAGGN